MKKNLKTFKDWPNFLKNSKLYLEASPSWSIQPSAVNKSMMLWAAKTLLSIASAVLLIFVFPP